MGTEVLRPQDCLIGRVRFTPAVHFSRRRGLYNNSRPNRAKEEVPLDQRKKAYLSEPSAAAAISNRSSSSDVKSSKNLMMGQVMVLRRGKWLDSKILKKNGVNRIVSVTGRLIQDPEMVPKQIQTVDVPDVYAGSAFVVSPSPASIPLPSFSTKKRLLSPRIPRPDPRLDSDPFNLHFASLMVI